MSVAHRGPLLDRIDIHVEVPRVPYKDLAKIEPGEASEPVRERVMRAREIQVERFAKFPGIFTNARMERARFAASASPMPKGRRSSAAPSALPIWALSSHSNRSRRGMG
ncbi:MAG: hypothetical protein ABIK65_04175 [Candidatus Eisenbacteria bacterium]